MFSVDYPYAPNAKGRAFLERVALSPADMERLCWQNAAALLGLGTRSTAEQDRLARRRRPS